MSLLELLGLAAPCLFCGGVWLGRRLEAEQHQMNAEALQHPASNTPQP